MAVANPNPLPNDEVPISPQARMNNDWYQYFFRFRDLVVKLLAFTGASGATTVAALPSAASAGAGARSFVTDANATTFHNTVAGGGANKVPVVSDGTNWLIG